MRREELIGIAREQLERVVLPYWLEVGVDEEAGGFHTCYDNRGLHRTGTDKFTWSQGRFVWLLARAARLARAGRLSADSDAAIAHAKAGAAFLLTHAVNDDGTCRFAVGRNGGPTVDGEQPPRSVYADCFAAMGLAELARATGEARWLEHALPIVERARVDVLDGTAPTPPYPIPRGFESFGPPMILLNTMLIARDAASSLGEDAVPDETIATVAQRIERHRRADGTVAELIRKDGEVDSTSLHSRHRVPGHALEGTWMMVDACRRTGDEDALTRWLDGVPALCASGWDEEFGGMFRYTDADGPVRPSGTTTGSPYEDAVLGTWDTKLWWVHTEALATTAIAVFRHGRQDSAAWLDRLADYTFGTFPAGDEGREWIQIRDRRGAPIDAVIALPVKDPFHIARDLMEIVDL